MHAYNYKYKRQKNGNHEQHVNITKHGEQLKVQIQIDRENRK